MDVIQITSIVLVDCARKHVCDFFYTYIVVELYHVLKGFSKLFTVDIFFVVNLFCPVHETALPFYSLS